MTRSIPSSPRQDGYVVRRPRTSDALGASLRTVFDAPTATTCEFDALLQSIDRVSARH